MSQRLLLAAGALAIAAAVVIGAIGMATRPAGFSMMGPFQASSGRSISMERAQQVAQSFLDRTGDRDLRIDELMEFDRNFYALVEERSTGTGAFELLIDRTTGAVGFEPGPSMMWNARYGMMGGGRHMGFGAATGAMTVTPERAIEIAQGWLDQRGSGYLAGTPDAFYGYYTFHLQQDGRIAGMLSVNGATGQVWFHGWHGRFLQARGGA